MAFKSLNQVLGFLANQPLGLRLAEYKRLLECWTMAVGPAVANQSRPLSIDDRRVLKVATSSAALAQDLMFKRRGILQKLNALLPTQLVDIRFSTAQWGESVANRVSQVAQEQEMWREHPSRILDHSSGLPVRGTPVGSDPQGALQNWAQRIQARSQSLPLCPACQCPTPPGELERWSVCALCATKQWSSQLGSPPF